MIKIFLTSALSVLIVNNIFYADEALKASPISQYMTVLCSPKNTSSVNTENMPAEESASQMAENTMSKHLSVQALSRELMKMEVELKQLSWQRDFLRRNQNRFQAQVQRLQERINELEAMYVGFSASAKIYKIQDLYRKKQKNADKLASINQKIQALDCKRNALFTQRHTLLHEKIDHCYKHCNMMPENQLACYIQKMPCNEGWLLIQRFGKDKQDGIINKLSLKEQNKFKKMMQLQTPQES